MVLAAVPKPLQAGLVLVALLWLVLLTGAWRRSEKRLATAWRMTIYMATAASCISTVASRSGNHAVPTLITAVGTPLVTLASVALAAAAVLPRKGTTEPARPATPLLVTGLVAMLIVQLASGAHRGQLSPAYSMQLFGLVWVPALAIAAWRAAITGEELIRICYRLAVAVTGASLILAVALPTVAIIDNRRIPIAGVSGRLAGCTPHPNLLAFTAAMAMLLAIHLRGRRWRTVVVACAIALVLAEARSLTITLAVAVAIYWLFSGRSIPARLVAVVPIVAVAVKLLQDDAASSIETSGIASNLATLNSRTIVWDMVGRSWGQARMLGWGPAAFSDKRSPLSVSYFLHAHSQFWESIAEGGVLGLLAVTAVALGIAAIAFRSRSIPVIPAVAVLVLLTMTNEVPLTANLFGLSYTLTPALLSVIVPLAALKRTAQETLTLDKQPRPIDVGLAAGSAPEVEAASTHAVTSLPA